MELNNIIDKELTSEQKAKFERDNGKFRLLKNIVILPVILTIFGFYLESILIVTVGIIGIILFLLFCVNFTGRKNEIYEDFIIPYVFKQKIKNVECVKKDSSVEDEITNSKIFSEYDKAKCSNYFKIQYGKYAIQFCKVITSKLEMIESDGVVDKNLEQKFKGVFAYVKLPNKFENEFRVIKNEKSIQELYSINASNTQQVKMSNLEFDLKYDVYSMDQVSIRKILSPGVMARILDMNKKINNTINFSIYNNVLYMSIEYDKFLDFKSEYKNEYVNEEIANNNMDLIEIIDNFARYFINVTDI